MKHLPAFLLLLLALWITTLNISSCSAVSTWTGANSFPIYALNQTDRLAILDAMRNANMTVLRITISQVDAGTQGSSAVHVNDVEHPNVGDFDDTILGLIDQLMSEAKPRGIRLIIAMHDRYALGCNNRTDAYTKKYGLPVVDDCTSTFNAQNLSKFYTDAFDDFKNRTKHIMNYQSPSMGSYPWKYLSEAVFSFEPQHEAFGHVDVYNLDWLCNMCAYIKSVLGTTPIFVSTGGGTNFSTSLSDETFQCPQIDIISIHSFDTSSSNAQATLSSAVSQAESKGKRIVLEEFGAKTTNKTQILSGIATVANDLGVPWLFWEVMIPGQGAQDFEVSPTEDAWTNALAPASLTAKTKSGAFDWSFSTSSPTPSPKVTSPGNVSSRPQSTPPAAAVPTTNTVVGVVSGLAGFLALSFLLYLIYRKIYASRTGPRDEQDDSILDAIPGLPTRFDYNQLHLITNGFSNTLGKGGFGTVYAGMILSTGTKVAVKQLESVKQGDKEFRSEVAIMGGIHHYNLLRLIGFCAQGAHRLLVYEYMENGSLDRWLFCDPDTQMPLSWDLRCKIAVGAARGLAYLHEHCRKRILHLDIKPQNILLDENFVPKVADFGLSRLIGREDSHVMTNVRGTPGYLAPEWVKEGKIDQKCDVYSFGMLLMEITSGRRNVDHRAESEEQIYYPEWAFEQAQEGLLNKLTNATLETEEDRIQLKRMINTAFLCILQNPASRPSMETVVQMLEGNVGVSDIHESLHQGLHSVLRNRSTFEISANSNDRNWSYSQVSPR